MIALLSAYALCVWNGGGFPRCWNAEVALALRTVAESANGYVATQACEECCGPVGWKCESTCRNRYGEPYACECEWDEPAFVRCLQSCRPTISGRLGEQLDQLVQ